MKKYLMTWLLGLVSLLSFAQGDIPIKSDVVPPSADFIRPVYVPGEGLKYRKSDGSYISGRATRDPRLFLTWPAYLIQNPVLGDHAMGPSLTSDTTQRQHAIYNGNRWVTIDKPIDIVFNPAFFNKSGSTVSLNQFPYSLGNLHADQFSLANAPPKPTNPLQHTFLLYNPLTGKFEGMPYTDVVSAMGVVQWPAGSIGHIGVDGLYWHTPAQQLSADNLSLLNASFLVAFGENTYRMSMGDYLALIRTRLGLSSGLQGLNWVANPPKNQDSPGATNDANFYKGKLYVKSPSKWLQVNNVDSLFTTDYQPPSSDPVPLLTGQYDQSKSKVVANWSFSGTDVNSWDLFVSFNQDNQYQLVKSGIAAGDRTFSFDAWGGVTNYFLQVRGQRAGSKLTPFSNTASVAVTQQSAWSPFVDISLTPKNDAGAIEVLFYNTQAGGKAYLQITTNPNASATSDEGWTSLASVELPSEGMYSYTFTGIPDTQARYIRLWKEGTPRTPSTKQKVGPVALQTIPVQINAPIVTSVTNVTSTTATINFSWNNTNVTKGFIYQSLASPTNYTRTELAANATSYTATGLKPGTKYLFHLQAVKTGDVYSPYSTPETEITTSGTAEDAFPSPAMDYYENGTVFGNPTKDYVMYKKPQGIPSQPGQYDYRVGSGAWTFGDKETNAASTGYTPSLGWGANFFFHDKFQAGQTVRFRVRLWDYDGNKPDRYSAYSDVLKVVYGPNYRVNGNTTDFTVTKEAADQTPTGQVPPATQPLSVSILSQTASQLTIAIANPKNSGEVLYNMSVYKRGDPNASGSYQCSKGSRPGTSTITYNLSDCPLVTGGEYTFYIAEDNGNQPQTRQASINFVQLGSTGEGGGTTEIVPGVIPQGVISTNIPQETRYLTTANGSRIGFNYALGGSMTDGSLTHAPAENLVNNMDFGRQIQWAYYGWPIGAGFRPQGKSPGAAQWENIGWDPIQAGDFTTPSRVLQYKHDQANNAMYYRTKPRMWGYPDVECECHVDNWIRVNGNALEFTTILTNYRTDSFESNPRGQDIGGGFLNSYYRYWSGVVTDKPWTNQPITTFDRKNPQYGVIQVESDEYHTQRAWLPENWAHNSKNGQAQGLGIWSASPYFAFSTVSGLEVDANTSGPFSATFGTHKEMEHIDRKQVLRYDYAYIIGTAQETRNYAYSRRNETWNQINFDFSKDRQGWWTNENFPDGHSSRYPFEGYWEVKYDQKFSNFGSAEIAVATSKYTKLEIEVAVTGGPSIANINLLRHRNNGLRYNNQQGTAMDDTNYSFAVTTDGQFRKYTIDLTSNPAWANSIVSKIYLDFGGGPAAGRMVRLKSIKGLP